MNAPPSWYQVLAVAGKEPEYEHTLSRARIVALRLRRAARWCEATGMVANDAAPWFELEDKCNGGADAIRLILDIGAAP